jgi:hypothetical protein
MTLDEKISQMIVPAIRTWNGTEVTDLSAVPELASALQKHQYGGVILFGQNVKDTEQTARLVSDLQANNAKIGAGAVVVKPVPSDVTVAGVPAKIVRDRRNLDEFRHSPAKWPRLVQDSPTGKVSEKDESIVYFANFEDLALPTEDAGNGTGLGQLVGTVNNWWNFTNGYWERFDGGRGIRLDADSYVWTEPIAVAGTYNVVIYGRNDVSQEVDNPYVLGLKTGDDIKWLASEEATIKPWGSATTGENVVENVVIPDGASLVIKNDDAAKMISLDDIKVVKPTPAEPAE